MVGIANHPETIGTFSFCGENSSIIENICDLEQAITKMAKTQIKKALLITQTTFNLRKFEEIAEHLKGMLEDTKLKVINTICLSTELRQKETERVFSILDEKIKNKNQGKEMIK